MFGIGWPIKAIISYFFLLSLFIASVFGFLNDNEVLSQQYCKN
jgi:hypothetical protein